jgi:hypothetical protein
MTGSNWNDQQQQQQNLGGVQSVDSAGEMEGEGEMQMQMPYNTDPQTAMMAQTAPNNGNYYVKSGSTRRKGGKKRRGAGRKGSKI